MTTPLSDPDIKAIMERAEKANKAYEVPDRPRTTGEDMLRFEDIRIFDKHSRRDIPTLCRDLLMTRVALRDLLAECRMHDFKFPEMEQARKALEG